MAGIKGMKWGVRKSEVTSRANFVKRPRSEDAKSSGSKKTQVKRHGTDALSNDQLKSLVNRMNLEQQYAKLAQKPSPARSGRKYVADILKDVGTAVLTEVITSQVKDFMGGRGGGSSSGPRYGGEYAADPMTTITQIRKAIGR